MKFFQYIWLLFAFLILQSNSCNQSFKKTRLSEDEIWWNELNEHWKELMLRESNHLGEKINEEILVEVLQLKQFSADHYPVYNLEPVKRLTQLEILSAGNTQITHLKPIEKLTKLKSLSLPTTPIDDLTPLKNLQNLEEIYIQQTLVNDLSPISSATSLQVLVIFDTQITSLLPILKFKKLSILNISGLNILKEELNTIRKNNPECEIIK